MKLRNKKTGEITSDISFIPVDENRVAVDEGFRVIDTLYSSITDLCEEWEDYEDDKPWKPKKGEKYYYADYTPDEKYRVVYSIWDDDGVCKARWEMGDCYRTPEEVELFIKKRKAWKRLQDAGFRFEGFSTPGAHEIKYSLRECYGHLAADMHFIFGGNDGRDR